MKRTHASKLFGLLTLVLGGVAVASPVEPPSRVAVIDPAAATSSSLPAPVLEDRPFEPGEFVRFSLSYLGMNVGEFRAEVGEREWGGKRVWPIETRGETEGFIKAVHNIEENFTSLFDPATGRAVGSIRSMRQNDFWQREETRFEGAKVWIHTRKPDQEYEQWKETTDGAHDLVSAIYSLRARPMAVGEVLDVPVFTVRQTWTMKVRVAGREKVQTPMGEAEALVLKLRTQFSGKLASERELTLWITDDARRLPVKLEASFLFGSVTAQAVEYRRGLQASR